MKYHDEPQRSSCNGLTNPILTIQHQPNQPASGLFYGQIKVTSLYNLTGQYLELAHKLSNIDLDSVTVADTIEASGLPDDIALKAQGIEMVCRETVKDLPAIDAEIKRLQALKAHRVAVSDGLKAYLKRSMEAMGIEKIQCPLFTVSIRQNPASVEVFEEGMVPDEYMVAKYSPSKTKIKEALVAGVDVPGARMAKTTRLDVK